MNKQERRDNQDRYLTDISHAIRDMVARCGGGPLDGTDESPLPDELSQCQRAVYVHSGITGILSMAILEHNIGLIKTFDHILTYYAMRSRGDERQEGHITNMFGELINQVGDTYARTQEDHDKFLRFRTVMHLAMLILEGHITEDDTKDLYPGCSDLVDREFQRMVAAMRRDIEKN